MRVASLSLGLAASIFSAGSVSAKERILAASSDWNVDYAEDSCNLRRTFGEGEDKVGFEMQQASTAPYYNLFLTGGSLRKSRSDVMSVRFGPTEPVSDRGFLMGKRDESNVPFLIMFGIHLAAVAKDAPKGEFSVIDIGSDREREITQVTLSKGPQDAITLQTGPMDKPLDALRTCVDDLVKTLGLSEYDQKSPTTQARLSNIQKTARFIQERYPEQHLRNEADGTVQVKVLVNPQGKATVCQVANSTRPAVFDDYVCFTMLRVAEYEPALDAEGRPVYSFLTQSVRFRVN